MKKVRRFTTTNYYYITVRHFGLLCGVKLLIKCVLSSTLFLDHDSTSYNHSATAFLWKNLMESHEIQSLSQLCTLQCIRLPARIGVLFVHHLVFREYSGPQSSFLPACSHCSGMFLHTAMKYSGFL